MLTVNSLLEELGLETVAGGGAAGKPIRWVHISELEDPTPWLSGGELVLTTGINLTSQKRQRELVKRLAEREVAGLGFGTGFTHSKLPAQLVAAADKHDLPLFEVPYETPFIALTERAFKTLVNESYGVLERGVQVHAELERLVLAERGLPEIMDAIAAAAGGAALLWDARAGRARAIHSDDGFAPESLELVGKEIASRSRASSPGSFVLESGPLAGSAVAVPVPLGGEGGGGLWLVVRRGDGPVGDLERLLARQAAMVVALELMRERAVSETERRLAGDVLAEALGGNLGAEELRSRLGPFGIGERVAVLLFELEGDASDPDLLTAALERAGAPALVAVNTAAGRPLLCAIVDPGEHDPIDLGKAGRDALGADGRAVRAAASRAGAAGSLRRAFHEARCALEATALANGRGPEVASHRDLGAFTLLLSIQDDDALRTYADNLLAPIEDNEGEYGPELLRSLEAFIERNGQWEKAARDLYCHRHTLRYRIRRVEEITGRDLGQAQDRIELWLALRARELVR
jgi:PucR family transcriptional regulator, purine catabolism regulatory protein